MIALLDKLMWALVVVYMAMWIIGMMQKKNYFWMELAMGVVAAVGAVTEGCLSVLKSSAWDCVMMGLFAWCAYSGINRALKIRRAKAGRGGEG